MFELRDAPSNLRNNRGPQVISGAAKSVLIAFLFMGVGSAGAKTVFVNGAVSKSGNGTSWASAYKYLRDALDNSKSKDVIYLAKGTYYPDDGASGNFGDRQDSFEIKGQKIYGGFAGRETDLEQRNPQTNVTVLSGAIWDGPDEDVYWSLHVVVVNTSSLLDGVTVADGRANGASVWNFPQISEYDEGGGCYVQSGATLTLSGCNFRGNQAFKYGGAIAVKDTTGKVVATNCAFEDNSVEIFPYLTPETAEGGAIKGNVDATDCRFISNSVVSINARGKTVSTSLGGAISGDVTATRCIFSGNNVKARVGIDIVTPDANPVASGGAVYGNIVANQCTFTGNESSAPVGVLPPVVPVPVVVPPVVVPPVVGPPVVIPLVGVGVSSGGAIAGGSVVAVNCAFSLNKSATGKIEEKDGTGSGGGGAIYLPNGKSSLVNCVFSENTSRVRGGAIHSAAKDNVDSLIVSNCTFVDNGVANGFRGAALSCGGIVRTLNNVFWYTNANTVEFSRYNLIHVSFDGVLRNSPVNYPDPTTVAPNIVKGGVFAVSTGIKGNTFLGSPTVSILELDPLFVNISDPDGPDNAWGTADDGFRLRAGSPAIGSVRDPRITDPENFLLKDTADVDLDGNRTELMPVDLAGYARVQDRFVDIGAYELGNALSAPEIAVFEEKGAELQTGRSSSFGSVAVRSNRKKVFVIRNTGQNSLKNLSYSITGSKVFTLKKSVIKSLEQGTETKLTVTFKPTRKGKNNAKLIIVSNDTDENPFTVKLSGQGTVKRKKNQQANFALLPPSSFTPALFGGVGIGNSNITTTKLTGGYKYLVLTVQKSSESGEADPIVEVSSNLLDWSSGPEHTTTLLDSSSCLSVRDNIPLGQGGKRYIRVK